MVIVTYSAVTVYIFLICSLWKSFFTADILHSLITQCSHRHWFYKCTASCQLTVVLDIHWCSNCSCATSMHSFTHLSHHLCCLSTLFLLCDNIMQGFKKLLMKVVNITDTVFISNRKYVMSADIVLQYHILHMKESRIGLILGTEASKLMWYGYSLCNLIPYR
jgi:hypothetical protein